MFGIISFKESRIIKYLQYFVEYKDNAEKKGTSHDNMDLLIAVSAMALGTIFVTHNVKHFSRIKGLKVEDWC
jgi:predicted nucleic acid-binding protein